MLNVKETEERKIYDKKVHEKIAATKVADYPNPVRCARRN